MTEQQRRQICADLARRMGYFVAVLNRKYGLQSAKIIYTRWRETENEAWMDAPDPSTNAADKDALVKWLAADHTRWERFDDALFAIYDMWKGAGRDAQIRNAMTAPLEVIALAACKALGIQEASE